MLVVPAAVIGVAFDFGELAASPLRSLIEGRTKCAFPSFSCSLDMEGLALCGGKSLLFLLAGLSVLLVLLLCPLSSLLLLPPSLPIFFPCLFSPFFLLLSSLLPSLVGT